MPIVWRDSMSVGNTVIDQDHRYLFCLINTVELALRLNQDADMLEAAVSQLVQYTRDHFAREEALQLKVRYPGYVDHKVEHQRLLERVGEIQRQVLGQRQTSTAADAPPSALDPGEIAGLLREWILGHVLKRDLQLRSYFARLYPGPG